MFQGRRRLAGFLTLLALSILFLDAATSVLAHPEEFSERLSRAELVRREHLAKKRYVAARSCASSINAFHATRRAKRSLSEQVPLKPASDSEVDNTIHSYTCVTAPEIEEGPYYVNDELVRQDLTEEQIGVALRLDIGVIDTATCEPVPDAFVEIWSANATGFYGAFETNTLGPPPGRHPPPGDRPPTRPPPPRRPGGGPSMTSNNTWLRGGFPTDASGTVELTTIYPGFYPGRTVHVHLMVHTGAWESDRSDSSSDDDDGRTTIVSHSGLLSHVGQMFFDELWNEKVLATRPYNENIARGPRTTNEQDHDFRLAMVNGSSGAIVQLELVKDTIEEGLLGFITIGIDTTAEYAIRSGNYYNSTVGADSSESSYVVDVDV